MIKSEISKITAKILINIGAINFSPQSPFKLSSGFLSPSYIDCRKIISYPSAFKAITDMMIDTIQADMIAQSPNYIIGGETAGIPFGAGDNGAKPFATDTVNNFLIAAKRVFNDPIFDELLEADNDIG